MSLKILNQFVRDGIIKNKKTVFPFLIAGITIVTIYYILDSLAFTPYIYRDGVEAFYGAQTLAILLEISSQIVMIFSVIFMIYANRFVMKERKREMGLYGILGLSKKNINMILVLDTLIKAVFCIGGGIIVGTILNKLALLTLYKIIHQPVVSGLLLVPKSVLHTVVLFAVIFLICLIMNILSVNISNPVELLRSDRTGEREPKVKIGMLIVGIATIAAGYYIALTTKSTFDAISMLFAAVFLVMCGTYCLFITGSIFILKQLKKNKRFYYKTKNFISVSNLIYRMKHNAAGLASICILSTAVLILMTSASSLSLLGEKNLERMFPTDIKLEAADNRDEIEDEYKTIMQNAADQAGIDMENGRFYRYMTSAWETSEDGFQTMKRDERTDFRKVDDIYMLTAEDYNRYAGTDIKLQKHEILFGTSGKRSFDEINILGENFKVVGETDYKNIGCLVNPTMSLFTNDILVFDSRETIKDLLVRDEMAGNPEYMQIYVGFDIKDQLTEEQMEQFSSNVYGSFDEEISDSADAGNLIRENLDISFKQKQRAFFYNIYGGMFFVGIFLAILFLLATVLIIYYKQMSEGFEDQKRYQILSYVGLTEEETKYTIKRQVMILFFLPVLTAIIHMVVASNIVKLFLQMVMYVEMATYIASMAVVSVVFVVIYCAVYKITSVEYYKIVNAGR